MLFSVITIVKNRKETISYAINSVLKQTFKDFEYLIIDSNSSDGTSDIIKSLIKERKNIQHIRESDNGIYDALNKGIEKSNGKYIFLVHSDDFIEDKNLFEKASQILFKKKLDILFGKAIYFKRKNGLLSKSRLYNFKNLDINSLSSGLMPCHTTMFINANLFSKYGNYNSSFKIASDFEFLLRVVKKGKILSEYNENIIIFMQMGGVSSKGISSFLSLNKEVRLAGKLNGVNITYTSLFKKYLNKIKEYL